MAKKLTLQPERKTREFRLAANYAEYVLCPDRAIGEPGDVDLIAVLNDGTRAKVTFVTTWNNEGDYWLEELNRVCMERYQYPFGSIKEIWERRLGRLGNYWHLIKLEKI